MRNIKLIIEYDGTAFQGWQIQKNQRTIQGEIEKALQKIFQKQIRLIGSSRTDSGAHAMGQVANFKTTSTLSTEKIQRALNATLPKDIVIREANEASLNFHARYNVKRKTYRYTVLNRKLPSPLYRHSSCYYPYRLNVSLMRREAKALLGKKNFGSFVASNPSQNKMGNYSSLRTISRLTIRRNKDFIILDIEANGFLYKMVRNIVGTLLEIGSGKLPKGSMKTILKKKNRNFASKTVAACGLCLMKVTYPFSPE